MVFGKYVRPLRCLRSWLVSNDPEAVGLLDDTDALQATGCNVPLPTEEAHLVGLGDNPLVVD